MSPASAGGFFTTVLQTYICKEICFKESAYEIVEAGQSVMQVSRLEFVSQGRRCCSPEAEFSLPQENLSFALKALQLIG